MFEAGTQNFDEIFYRVGYEDSNFFRKVFVQQTGLRPKEYNGGKGDRQIMYSIFFTYFVCPLFFFFQSLQPNCHRLVSV
jgi:AraC-like DNA-binding protein